MKNTNFIIIKVIEFENSGNQLRQTFEAIISFNVSLKYER
jgi:hypothetical protein